MVHKGKWFTLYTNNFHSYNHCCGPVDSGENVPAYDPTAEGSAGWDMDLNTDRAASPETEFGSIRAFKIIIDT